MRRILYYFRICFTPIPRVVTLKGIRVCVAALITSTMILSVAAISFESDHSAKPTHERSGISAYIAHAPISINNDTNFSDTASREAWPGDGSPGNPYIIADYEINATNVITGIYIGNTTVHFRIQDCRVYGAGQLDILLYNVTNGMLLRDVCTLAQNGYGVYLKCSRNCVIEKVDSSSNSAHGLYLYYSNTSFVRNSTFSSSGSGYGVLVSYSNGNCFENISCLWNNKNGAYLYLSSGNRIWNSTFYHNNGSSGTYNPSYIQAFNSGAINWWNTSGAPHGYGNYWSDWTTPDGNHDGIVDNPYNIPGGSGARDYWPLASLPHFSSIDLNPPMTGATAAGTSGLSGWYVSAVNVTLSRSDAGAGLNGWGSDVNWTKYRLNGTGWQTYNGQFTISDDGNFTLEFYSADNAGNLETAKNLSVKIDKTAPVSGSSIAGSTVTITAHDAMSGVDTTVYRMDNGSWQNYSTPFKVEASGNHTIEYYSIDDAGNIEGMKTTWVDNGMSPFEIISSYGLYIVIAIIVIVIIIAIANSLSKGRDRREE